MTIEKQYIKALNIQEAISTAVNNGGNFKFLAGGTDILPNKFQGNELSECLIDISNIDELKGIYLTENLLKIGSSTTLDELRNNDFIKENFPTIIEAAISVGTPVIRKSATVGGNLLCENRCHFYNQSAWWREAAGNCLKCGGDICLANGGKKYCYSKFISDTAIALISLDAKIEIIDKSKTTITPLEEIYNEDGINRLNIDETAMIKSIQIPLNKSTKSVYMKLRQRKSVEFSSLTTSVTLFNDGKLKIAAGAIAPNPIVVEGKKGDNLSELIDSITKKSRIVVNDNYSRAYRKNMIRVFLNRSFNQLQLIEK